LGAESIARQATRKQLRAVGVFHDQAIPAERQLVIVKTYSSNSVGDNWMYGI
jgi:hypothetical protein